MLPLFFQNQENIKVYLADELINSRLVLIIGSGLSYAFNVPMWDTLVDKVCQKADVINDSSKGNLILMDYCKNKLQKNFVPVVKSLLYENFDTNLSTLSSHKTLVALGALIIGSKRGKVKKMITYNYDDIIETYLLYHGYMPNPITDTPYLRIDSDIDIFHAHGYLPKFFGNDSEKIVLTQKSYSEIGNYLTFPFYREIESVLLSSTCLLIGISGKDHDMDSLFVNAHKLHYKKGTDNILGFIIREKNGLDEDEEAAFNDRGIVCIKIDNYDRDIPVFLSDVCRIALTKAFPTIKKSFDFNK